MSVDKPRSCVVIWRDAIRDSNLPLATKCVGFVHSTLLDAVTLQHRYGREQIAAGASASRRTVDIHNQALRDAGFLWWPDNKGGRKVCNSYVALMPETANELHRSEWERGLELRGKGSANSATDDVNRAADDVNGAGAAHDLDLSSRSRKRGRARDGEAARLKSWLERTAPLLDLETALTVLDDFRNSSDAEAIEDARARLYAIHGHQHGVAS